MKPVLEFLNISRSYKRGVVVLKDVSFSVGQGEVVALLGRNGTGKTTLINIALGLVKPERGEVRVFGMSPKTNAAAIRERIGYASEDGALRGGETVGELIAFHRKFFRRWNDALENELLNRFGLSRRDRIRRLSNGQQRQVGLLCAVSHYADLLLLDEPAAGLDPAARREFLETSIQLLNREGTTILFSSHHMTDVERLGGRIVLLDQGTVRLDRDLDRVRGEVCVAIVPRALAPNGDVFQHAAGCLRVRAAQQDWHVVIEGAPDDVRARLAGLIRNERIHCAAVPLEELFVELVGSERQEDL